MTTYRIHSYPAIVGGLLTATGAIALLTKDAWTSGITLDHAMMPLLVGVTILAGHLFWQAAKEWKPISAIGFGALALYGSVLTITETMGRRAEVSDTKVMVAEDAAAKLAQKAALEKTLALALPNQKQECAGAPSPIPPTWPECRRKTAHVQAIEAQIAALAMVKAAPVDAKGQRLAAIAGMLGFAPEKATSVIRMFEPFAFPLFLELGAIVLFGFGVRHQVEAHTFEVPKDKKELEEAREFFLKPEAVKKLKERGMKHDEIAALFGVNQGRISELYTGKREVLALH